MKSYVFGFDLSLTAPACVALPLDWRPGDWRAARAFLIRPKAPKNDNIRGQYERYNTIFRWAITCIESLAGKSGARSAVYIEAYDPSKNGASASKLMELGGITRLALFNTLGIVAETVNTSQALRLLLGKVPRSDQKIAVQDALFNKGGAPHTWEENICDALVVANWGLSICGGTALTFTKS